MNAKDCTCAWHVRERELLTEIERMTKERDEIAALTAHLHCALESIAEIDCGNLADPTCYEILARNGTPDHTCSSCLAKHLLEAERLHASAKALLAVVEAARQVPTPCDGTSAGGYGHCCMSAARDAHEELGSALAALAAAGSGRAHG